MNDVRILIVDDLSIVRSSLRVILRKLGYNNIVEASDGFDALDRMREGVRDKAPIDIVLCDLSMPHMDGPSFLRNVRSDLKLRDTSVYIVTGERDSLSGHQAVKAGATGFLTKPLSPDAIEEILWVHLNGPQLSAA